MKSVRIGVGAGFSGDRIEPAVELAEKGRLDFLAFECLAERTIALAQLARLQDPNAGFDPLLERRMAAVLPPARANGVRIVSNMGAANPQAAARTIARMATRLGITGMKIAAVLGDDVLDNIRALRPNLSDGRPFADVSDSMISANAYLGAASIVDALDQGADVVVTGRVGDPALFLAPLIHAFRWQIDDWNLLAQGTAIGHLLECAGQLTGGYFADPGRTEVPDLARLGFPLAEVRADGRAVFSKVDGSGGMLSVATCKEQLLYEVLDPGAYVQPDVVVDFRQARIEQVGPDQVALSGVTGTTRPEQLKVSIGHRAGFLGEGQISYAGPGAVARGRLALDIVRERLALTGVATDEIEASLIGLDSVDRTGRGPEPREVRARFAARTGTMEAARQVGAEVEALYTNGPGGGGGVQTSAREIIAIASTFVDRGLVHPSIVFEES